MSARSRTSNPATSGRSLPDRREIIRAVSDAKRVFWKWEDEEDDGEGVGPVWIEQADGTSVDWEEWVRRSVAEAYATEHGLEFAPDE